jgi:hypothetical protein
MSVEGEHKPESSQFDLSTPLKPEWVHGFLSSHPTETETLIGFIHGNFYFLDML